MDRNNVSEKTGRDVQNKNVANNVDRVKIKGTMTNWPLQKQTKHSTKHAKEQDVISI